MDTTQTTKPAEEVEEKVEVAEIASEPKADSVQDSVDPKEDILADKSRL